MNNFTASDLQQDISCQTGFIYGLRTKSNPQIRYIGFAVDPRKRLMKHKVESKSSKHTHKLDWMRSVGAENIEYVILSVVYGGIDALKQREVELIAEYGRDQLTNSTDGGDGAHGLKHTSESREKIKAKRKAFIESLTSEERAERFGTMRGVTMSDDARNHLSNVFKGRQVSEETRAKLSAAHTGKVFTPEHRSAIRKSKQNISAETRAKIAAAHTGKVLSKEHKEKLRTASTGRKHTPEAKAKIAASNSRRIVSAETKALMRERALARPRVECPHCGVSAHMAQAKRWHFDNCKQVAKAP